MVTSSVERVCVVTGAGSGIGRAASLHLAAQGVAIVLNDVDEEALSSVAKEIMESGGLAVTNRQSVGSVSTAESLVASALEGFGRLDVLINCAGFLRDRMTHNMTEEEFDSVIEVHLRGSWACGRAAIQHWRPLAKAEAEAGERVTRKIINVTSASGLVGASGQSNYAAAKMGVVGLTKAWAKELGPLQITCNAIAPVADTPMTRHLLEEPEAAKARYARFPLGRYGSPDEIAKVFVFMASAESDYITGQVLCVDGGLVI